MKPFLRLPIVVLGLLAGCDPTTSTQQSPMTLWELEQQAQASKKKLEIANQEWAKSAARLICSSQELEYLKTLEVLRPEQSTLNISISIDIDNCSTAIVNGCTEEDLEVALKQVHASKAVELMGSCAAAYESSELGTRYRELRKHA